MADYKNSSLSSQVIAGLIVAAVVTAVSFIPGTFKWALDTATDFWSHLFGASALPNWSLYLLALLSLNTIIYWTALVIKQKGPNISAYNHDTFLGLKWRWSYISGNPTNAWAFCPHCDTMLVYSNIGAFSMVTEKQFLLAKPAAKTCFITTAKRTISLKRFTARSTEKSALVNGNVLLKTAPNTAPDRAP